MIFAIVNESKDVSKKDALWIARAMRVQMAHVARAFHLVPSQVLHLEDHRVLFEAAEIWPIILTSDVDRARSLGWHTKFAGSVFSYVFVKTIQEAGGQLLRGSDFTISGVVGHELAEMKTDPEVNIFVKLPEPLPEGDMVAYEISDPVQDEYETKAGFLGLRELVNLSNFVHPSWFRRGPHPAGTKFDEKGRLSAPFTKLPSGYLIVQDSTTGRITSVFDHKPPEWQLRGKRSEFSRTFRRGARIPRPV